MVLVRCFIVSIIIFIVIISIISILSVGSMKIVAGILCAQAAEGGISMMHRLLTFFVPHCHLLLLRGIDERKLLKVPQTCYLYPASAGEPGSTKEVGEDMIPHARHCGLRVISRA